jgi:hypothetical protein
LPRIAAAVLLLAAAAALLVNKAPQRRIIRLTQGLIEVHSEMHVAANSEVAGAGTVLHAAPDFQGRAIVVVDGPGVRLRDFTVDGNRDALEVRTGLPPSNVPFSRYTRANGIFAEGVSDLQIERVTFRNIAGFAVLVGRSERVAIDQVRVEDSGSRDSNGRNNTTGGVLLEEATDNFRVTSSAFRNIRGNGVWTHSLYTSPRNVHGLISENRFDTIGRDAIQVGHAVAVRVEENSGRQIGFPADVVDIEHLAVPAALDTAGNVERSVYARNRFEELDGKCIDLDGFHDGEILDNSCVNRSAAGYPYSQYGIVMNNSNPDMQSRNIHVVGNTIVAPRFGGIFVIGEGHVVARNRLLDLNRSHVEEPELLGSGIFLGLGANRPAPARGNRIEDNEITGYRMAAHCLGFAPGVARDWNTIRGNQCR